MLADKGGSRPSLASSVYQRLRRGLGSSSHSLASQQQRRRRRRSNASSTQRNPTSGMESRASCASPSEDPIDNAVFKLSESEASSLSSMRRSESDYSLQDRGCGGRGGGGGGGGGQHVNRSLSRRSTAAKAELVALMRSANRTTSIHPLRGVRSDNFLSGRDREHGPHPHLLRRGVTALSFRNAASTMSSSEHLDAAAAATRSSSVNRQLRQRLQALQSAQSEVIRLLDKEILLEDAADHAADPAEIVGALEERTEMLRRQLRSRNTSESTTMGAAEETVAAKGAEETADAATSQCQQPSPFSSPLKFETQLATDILPECAAQDGITPSFGFENHPTVDQDSSSAAAASAIDLAKRLLTANEPLPSDVDMWHGYESEVAECDIGADAVAPPLEPINTGLPASAEEMADGAAVVVDAAYGTELTTIEEQPELGYQSDSSETEALLTHSAKAAASAASATNKTKHKSDLTTVEESEESAAGVSAEQLPPTVLLDSSSYSEKAV